MRISDWSSVVCSSDLPVGQHAEPLEILALARHLLSRIFTAFFTKGLGVELVANLSVLLLDLQLDRQTVAVPARHEARIKPVKARGLEIGKASYRERVCQTV